MKEVLAADDQILEFIPQRAPIVMVDKLFEVDEESCKTGLFISKENIFVQSNELLVTGMIENIAQSSALMVGYQAKQKKEEVKRGFIGAVKKLKVHKLPAVDTEIETKIQIQTQVMNVSIVEGTVYQGEEILANCTMNIFLEED